MPVQTAGAASESAGGVRIGTSDLGADRSAGCDESDSPRWFSAKVRGEPFGGDPIRVSSLPWFGPGGRKLVDLCLSAILVQFPSAGSKPGLCSIR